jgi:subtilase family serine protease
MTSPAQPYQRDLSVRASQKPPAPKRRRGPEVRPLIEPLELRQLLSGTGTHHPLATPFPLPGTIAPPTDGYSPAQIRHAYGWDQVGLDGTGQTIALVDAYNTANIRNDLKVFDAQFSLPDINLTIVNENGGTQPPSTPDPTQSWSTETALDVEWAHAMAPGAKILLVQVRAQNIVNLMDGVDYARHVPGVSAISMSWGRSFSIPESSTQLKYDQVFTTPAGHIPITFVAASGDNTFRYISFPGSSPNVLTVGGTSLITDANNIDGTGAGTYVTEGSWNEAAGFGGSTGGFSNEEQLPFYQKAITSSQPFLETGSPFRRAVPDVSYLADPVSDAIPFTPADPTTNPPTPPRGTKPNGFAIYDADGFGVTTGWTTVGGTSAGSPQWAALIALANQQRVAAGMTTLDGFTETLPALYGVYRNPGAADFATYTNVFHDVDDSTTNNVHPATPGYDLSTGLGSPKVPGVIATLFAATPATDTSPIVSTATPSASSPFVTGTILSPLPITVAPGDTVKLKAKLKNITNGLYQGPVVVNIFASTSPTPDGSPAIATITFNKVKLKAGKSKKVTLSFNFPNNLGAGDYFFSLGTDTSAVSTPSGA